jgi:beta-phosphoglucomutase-like phosphatase (HAD superfamily)
LLSPAAHEALHARRVKLALASSSNEDEVEYYTQLLGVGELLETSTSKRDAEVSKPSPEIFRAALDDVEELVREIERIDHYFSE